MIRRGFRPVVARRLVLPVLVGMALAGVAGCGAGPTAEASPVATTTVDLPPSYRFAPAAIVVPTGATVTWTNHDNFTHNVSFEGADPRSMAPGESVDLAFETPGLHPYVCSLHPKDMRGSVLVAGS